MFMSTSRISSKELSEMKLRAHAARQAGRGAGEGRVLLLLRLQ
jgi:hypothetical protein